MKIIYTQNGDMRMRYVIDIDGVIAETQGTCYDKATPQKEAKRKLRGE